MRAEIAGRALRDHRRSLVAWSIGIALYVTMIVAVWPSIRDSADLTKAFQDYPDALKQLFGGEASFDFSTASGFLNAELYSLMFPLLLSVFAIGFGAGVLAGEEELGLLDLVLAQPVARHRVVLEKGAALVVSLTVLTVVSLSALLIGGAAVGFDVGVADLCAATVGAMAVALVMGLVALAGGACSGRRAVAVGVGAAAFGGTYLLQVVGGFVDALEPLRWAAPIHLANGSMPVRNGWPVAELCGLVTLAAALLVGARVAFARRDLGR